MSPCKTWLRRIAVLLPLLTLFSLTVAPVRAASDVQAGYTLKQAYSCALRYVRIDLGASVTERDPETAYVLFEYRPAGSKELVQGAVEIIERDKGVKIVVRLAKLPSYQERALRDALMSKLTEDYGAPPRPAPSGDGKKPPASTPPAEGDTPPKGSDGSGAHRGGHDWKSEKQP